MEVIAQLNRVRLAPRKVRAVAQLIKGRGVEDALDQLAHMVRRPVPQMSRLVKSSVANAEHNFNMVRENLYIKDIQVNEGMKLKRFMPKGFSRVSPIEKKTSHIKVILEERTPGLRRKVQAEKPQTPLPSSRQVEKEEILKKPEVKRELGKKTGIFGKLGRKIFQRKAV